MAATAKLTLIVPRVPKHLTTVEGVTLPVSAINEDDLRELGKAWTEALIKNAQHR